MGRKCSSKYGNKQTNADKRVVCIYHSVRPVLPSQVEVDTTITIFHAKP